MKYAITLLAASTLSVSAREYITYITQVNEFANPNGPGTQRTESIIADIDASGQQIAPTSVMGRSTFELIADEVLTPDEIDRGLVETRFVMDRDTTVEYDIEADITAIGPSADPYNTSKAEGLPARTKAGIGFHVEYNVSGLQVPGTINNETGAVWPLAATELKLQHNVDDYRNSGSSSASTGEIKENGVQTVFYNTALVDAASASGEFGTLGKETFSAFVLPDQDHLEDALQDEDSVIIFPKENGSIDFPPPADGGSVYREAPEISITANNIYPEGSVFVVVSGGALETPLLLSERKNTSAESDSFSFSVKNLDEQLPGSGQYVIELRYVDYFVTTTGNLDLEGSIVIASTDPAFGGGPSGPDIVRVVNVRSNVFTAE